MAGDWAIIHFTENEGMAWGMTFGGDYGKLILSVFRLAAVSALAYYIWALVKKKDDNLYIACIALIFAGAVGNIIDSVFYGMIFSDSNFEVARFMPAEGGYASFLHGSVVDMFYFPIIEGHFPSWFPVWGSESFEFFRPVFNFADFSISVGVAIVVLYQKRFFGQKKVVVAEEFEVVSAPEPTSVKPEEPAQ